MLPLDGNNFTIFVCGNKQHGVVGLQVALITCFFCDHCIYKEWKIRSVSCKKKILFHLSTTQKKVFSSLEDVLFGKMSTTDLVLLTPNLSPSCLKCSLQCISQTTQALSFLKKQTWQCEGKKFLALIISFL